MDEGEISEDDEADEMDSKHKVYIGWKGRRVTRVLFAKFLLYLLVWL